MEPAQDDEDARSDDAGSAGANAAVLVVAFDRGRQGSPAGYQWRLVARNGRVLGRSPRHHARRDESVEDFWQVCADAGALAVSVIHSGAPAGWIWRIENSGGEVVAESGKRFERYASCQRAGRRMVQHLSQTSRS